MRLAVHRYLTVGVAVVSAGLITVSPGGMPESPLRTVRLAATTGPIDALNALGSGFGGFGGLSTLVTDITDITGGLGQEFQGFRVSLAEALDPNLAGAAVVTHAAEQTAINELNAAANAAANGLSSASSDDFGAASDAGVQSTPTSTVAYPYVSNAAAYIKDAQSADATAAADLKEAAAGLGGGHAGTAQAAAGLTAGDPSGLALQTDVSHVGATVTNPVSDLTSSTSTSNFHAALESLSVPGGASGLISNVISGISKDIWALRVALAEALAPSLVARAPSANVTTALSDITAAATAISKAQIENASAATYIADLQAAVNNGNSALAATYSGDALSVGNSASGQNAIAGLDISKAVTALSSANTDTTQTAGAASTADPSWLVTLQADLGHVSAAVLNPVPDLASTLHPGAAGLSSMLDPALVTDVSTTLLNLLP